MSPPRYKCKWLHLLFVQEFPLNSYPSSGYFLASFLTQLDLQATVSLSPYHLYPSDLCFCFVTNCLFQRRCLHWRTDLNPAPVKLRDVLDFTCASKILLKLQWAIYLPHGLRIDIIWVILVVFMVQNFQVWNPINCCPRCSETHHSEPTRCSKLFQLFWGWGSRLWHLSHRVEQLPLCDCFAFEIFYLSKNGYFMVAWIRISISWKWCERNTSVMMPSIFEKL